MDRPFFQDTVTQIPAEWANAVTSLLFDVFNLANTKSSARNQLGLGTLSIQNANDVQIAGGSINNCPIGMNVPMQGQFTVLSIHVDPVSPEHAVNKRFLEQRLATVFNEFVRIDGSAMTGPLLLNGDPVEDLSAVPRRWVDQRLIDVIQERPIQRWDVISAGQAEFDWTTFVRPTTLFVDNFLVFVGGELKWHGVDYVMDVNGLTPKAVFNAVQPAAAKVSLLYFNNLDNLLGVPTDLPVGPGFSAQPGWSDPINMRVNYLTTNAGENQISVSHTILREMFFGCVVTSGVLGDRQVSWSTQWIPGTPGATMNPPELTLVSATEAKLTLPTAAFDHYWEGRLEITMLVDGQVSANKLWMDMANQVTPEYRDGRVRWGVIITTTFTPPLIESVESNLPDTPAPTDDPV
jgi:hypothetical protein